MNFVADVTSYWLADLRGDELFEEYILKELGFGGIIMLDDDREILRELDHWGCGVWK